MLNESKEVGTAEFVVTDATAVVSIFPAAVSVLATAGLATLVVSVDFDAVSFLVLKFGYNAFDNLSLAPISKFPNSALS